MSKVRSSDTKPEWILRCGLHRLGLRYKLNNKALPGNPDLVFPTYRIAIFVHGCFWHRHPGCKDASMPNTNPGFWTKKFAENLERDARAVESLSNEGWTVLVVWECELMKRTTETIEKVAHAIRSSLPTVPPRGGQRLHLRRKDLLTIAERKVRYRIDK